MNPFRRTRHPFVPIIGTSILILSATPALRAQEMPAAVSAPTASGPTFAYQDPTPFTSPTRPGYPSYPPGARYRWPAGLFYKQGHAHRRPPMSPRYFDYQKGAPHTRWWP